MEDLVIKVNFIGPACKKAAAWTCPGKVFCIYFLVPIMNVTGRPVDEDIEFTSLLPQPLEVFFGVARNHLSELESQA